MYTANLFISLRVCDVLFIGLISSLTITMSKLFGINVQYTVIKRYRYFKIKPLTALFEEVHTLFTHMHIKMQLVWVPPQSEHIGQCDTPHHHDR